MSNQPTPTQAVPAVPLKPKGFSAIPAVRRPVTGPPVVAGYPDGSHENQLGGRPVGKSS